MPYAIYSKRSKKISRIVHDLSSLLPSESVIEIDEESAFPRAFPTELKGQSINTLGLKLFNFKGSGEPTVYPAGADDTIADAVVTQKYAPLFTSYSKQPNMDFPVYANPFGWEADELAAAKYESILAKNKPYSVLVGEEWLDDDVIDSANSAGYIISEAKCIINPGGYIETNPFYFYLAKRVQAGSQTDFEHFGLFAFDTYYFHIEPELPPGLSMGIRFREWVDGESTAFDDPAGDGVAWQGLVAHEEHDLTLGECSYEDPSNPGEYLISVANGFQLRFENTTEEPYVMEQFMTLLRLKDPTRHPEGIQIIPDDDDDGTGGGFPPFGGGRF